MDFKLPSCTHLRTSSSNNLPTMGMLVGMNYLLHLGHLPLNFN